MIEWGSVLCDLFSACCSIAEGVVSMCFDLVRSTVKFCNNCFWTTERQEYIPQVQSTSERPLARQSANKIRGYTAIT